MRLIKSINLTRAKVSAEAELERFILALDAFPESPGINELRELVRMSDAFKLESIIKDVFANRFKGSGFVENIKLFLRQFGLDKIPIEKDEFDLFEDICNVYADQIKSNL